MNKIIVDFCPFVMEQNILVYSNGACIEQVKAPIDKMNTLVKGLQNKYGINQIDLCGNNDYLSRFKAELSLEFSNSDININIISK